MAKLDNTQAIIAWFKAALAHAGMSQAELARQIWNDDRSVPNKILLGRRKLQVHEMAAIQAATGYRAFDDAVSDAPNERIELPSRPSRKFHVKEWRVHSEWERADMAKAIGMDETDYGFRELNPHKFTIEEMGLVAQALKIEFDQLRFLPPKEKKATPTVAGKRRASVK